MSILPGIEISRFRKADHDILPIFVQRWSPRAMSAEPIPPGDILRLLEAARWAPSSYNEQPWRFLYARRDTPHWRTFLDILLPANQVWAKHAAALFLICSKKNFSRNNQPNIVHTFDCGSAWENFALQGAHMGLVVHGMAGFDKDKARKDLKIPDTFDIEAMIAVGKPGKIDDLPEHLRGMDREPSGRKKVSEFAAEGAFPGSFA